MLDALSKVLFVLARLILLPIRLFAWLVEAITGTQRRLREQRRRIEERPALPDRAFTERAGVPSDKAPIALATRRAVARACRVPANVLYPDDNLATLRSLMGPGPDAHWADLGPNWFEVVLHLDELLDLQFSCDEMDELDARWQERERNGELKNLQQLINLLVGFLREGRKTRRFPPRWNPTIYFP
jgi:hypothetical protein